MMISLWVISLHANHSWNHLGVSGLGDHIKEGGKEDEDLTGEEDKGYVPLITNIDGYPWVTEGE